jgi:hypothetical protein
MPQLKLQQDMSGQV